MFYNGENFDDIINVIEVSRPSISREYETVQKGKSETLTNYSDKLQEITVTAWIRRRPRSNEKSVEQLRDELLFYLTKETDDDRLIFSDRPDRYYNAKFSGEIELEYINANDAKVEITFSCKDGFTHSIENKAFKFNDDEAFVNNLGMIKAPLDIHVTFKSDANSIGISNEDDIVQLGTAYSEDEENFVPSDKIINDHMGTQQKKHWRENVGRVRWRSDSGDNTSQIMGSIDWSDKESAANVKTFGPIDKTKPGFWHGPTITRFLTNELPNFEAFHRFNFKPMNGKYGKKGAQGLIEINYADADSNFVMGFEMKDNTDKGEKIKYSFFIGTTRIIEMKLPNKIATEGGGFFGSIQMAKIGNKFTFKLARLRGTPLKETWSVTKTYHNETVAMLNASRIDCFLSQWKNFTVMKLGLTHTRLTQINTEDDTMVPLTFYKGDELFVEGTTNRVYINGIRDDNYRVIGSSQFLEAPTGETEYSVLTDGTYEGYLGMKERYL